MREPEADPYWQHDFAVDLSSLGEQPGFGIRFKAHESPEPYHFGPTGELVPLRVTRGTRLYFHGKPYQLEPDYRLTVALHPLPPPTGEVGVVEEARWEGLRQREIGQAQGWYYPQDATLIPWECFLEAHYRRGAPAEDPLHTAIWQGWERWLLSRSHGATRIVTTWEDLYDRPAWQNFLETQDYQPIAPAAFAEEVVSP
jgi:hypothetical protein